MSSAGERTTPADIDTALRTLLAAGPVDSRKALASLAAQGCTAKQVRRARERLQLTVQRSGNGAGMRSTWALLDTVPLGAMSVTVGASDDHGSAPKGTADARTSNDLPGAAPPNTAPSLRADLTAPEMVRVDDRVARFFTHGMTATAGAELAVRLVLERDRTGSRAGSCAECQCFTAAGCRPGSDGHTPGPRPLTDIWMCWTARRPY